MMNNISIIIRNKIEDTIIGKCVHVSGLSGNNIVSYDGKRVHKVVLRSCHPIGEFKELIERNKPILLSKNKIFFGSRIEVFLNKNKVDDYFFDIVYFECAEKVNDGYNVYLYANITCSYSENEIRLWGLFNGNQLTRGFWRNYSIDDKYSLLKINRLNFCNNPDKEIPISESDVFYINGNNIVDIPSLFIEIGESIRGCLGYFGGDYLALIDCIFGVNVENKTFNLVWKNHENSRNYLDSFSFLHDSIYDLNYSLRNLDYTEEVDNILECPEFKFECSRTPFEEVCSIFVDKGIILKLE